MLFEYRKEMVFRRETAEGHDLDDLQICLAKIVRGDAQSFIQKQLREGAVVEFLQDAGGLFGTQMQAVGDIFEFYILAEFLGEDIGNRFRVRAFATFVNGGELGRGERGKFE